MDFGWFLTIPGMLITGGVLLLIIALIIFITTSGKKSKKDAKNNNIESVNSNMNNDMGIPPLASPTPVDIVNPSSEIISPETSAISTSEPGNITNVEQPSISVVDSNSDINSISTVENTMPQGTPTIDSQPNMSEQTVTIAQPSVDTQITQMEPTVTPIVDNVEPVQKEESPVIDTPTMITPAVVPVTDNLTTPSATPVTEQQGNGTPDIIPVTGTPAVTPIDNMPVNNFTQQKPEGSVIEGNMIEPAVFSPVTPVTHQPEVSSESNIGTPEIVPITDTPVVQQPTPTPIYGGADPTVNNIHDNLSDNHPIYGGANPMENTPVIPVQGQDMQSSASPAPTVVPSVESVPSQVGMGNVNTSNQNG